MADQNDIPLATVIQHMQGMEQRLTTRIDGLEAKVDQNHVQITTRIDGLETKFDRLEAKVDRNHAQTTTQLDNIDSRLDDLEVVQVPALKKVVGMK